jgi:site-specific DNA-methyltransferase (cytosine-N4-specific)
MKGESESYIPLGDAAELTGFSVKHLRRLARAGTIQLRGNGGSTQALWPDVKKLAAEQKPFWAMLPDKAMSETIPRRELLMHPLDVTARPPADFVNKVNLGNCIEWMRQMPRDMVQSVVTSPPYWGVRTYPGELKITWADGSHVGFGEEPTVEGYVTHSLEVLRHLKRVLREDGTIWWNIGDTYQTRAYLRESSTERLRAFEGRRNDRWRDYPNKRYSSGHPYLKDKDLTLVPFLVALGAEHLGLYVRSIIIWYKDNIVPEPTRDRPTTSHEYILLLAKSRFYKYYAGRVVENSETGEVIKRVNGRSDYKIVQERKLRSVWQFPTSSRHGEHTAAFPIELPLRCLALSTDPGDLVFDPFAGSGTTLAAAKILNCNYSGCDIMRGSVADAERRLIMPGQPLNGTRPKTGAIQSRKPRSNKKNPLQKELLV